MELVHHAEKLTDIFGTWPSFHDAEVVRLALDRSGPSGTSLHVEIHVFEMTNQIDPAGFFVLKNQSLVALRFDGIDDLEMTEFNHQNVLSDLEIRAVDPAAHAGRSIAVDLVDCHGVDASFVCARCEVVSVEPWDSRS